ncbi:hypothetical protein [Streptomyces filamentosus]|uniref:Predicted protein n=1 Tax=Streptomyces filamentosus NRRL 15998 TaxID=457431 RepID=D6AQI0_STRFL|nr:hypothetical protein [Streptomyces filamentosus]EFE75763.1 predicted protein [Streptomyces filamentosus NRRL 15998]
MTRPSDTDERTGVISGPHEPPLAPIHRSDEALAGRAPAGP